ncbi:MAG: PH domain-containing protein [Deltaproteobacteria bacterium]|jgi:hypothetical protein|nr:PH domain-containing protein [Deltaproteobacteria bacterium]
MRWGAELEPEEKICWEGRPTPRCYVFRNWRHSVFGVLLLLLAVWWQTVGIQISAVYDFPWLSWLPIPFVLLGLYLSLGHLFLARLEWNHVFYAITDQRILVKEGLLQRRTSSLELNEVTYFCLHPHSQELGSIVVHAGPKESFVKIRCIEYPRRVTGLLEQAMNGKACLPSSASSE